MALPAGVCEVVCVKTVTHITAVGIRTQCSLSKDTHFLLTCVPRAGSEGYHWEASFPKRNTNLFIGNCQGPLGVPEKFRHVSGDSEALSYICSWVTLHCM